MKIASLILLISLIAVVSCYTDIRDEYNYDIYSKNIPILQQHLDCYLDKGPCDSVPKSVKPHLPEIIMDACHECNDTQKHHGRQFVKAAKDFLPAGYKEFRKKYDVDGKHFDAFEKAIANY